jgi:hypothetical protein
MRIMNPLKFIILFGYTILLSTLLVSCKPERKQSESDLNLETQLNPKAPVETNILGQLIGTWEAEQSFKNRDGSWNDEKKYAIWKWYYILDGHAIQDNWISVDSLNNENIIGTNIRIYNSEENQWYMAWIDKSNRRLATFTAINDSGTVIMDGTNAKRQHIRNTFFNISENEFDWKQEWTFDEGKSWVIVTKIHCKRKL